MTISADNRIGAARILILSEFLDSDMTLKGDQASIKPLQGTAVAKANGEKWDEVVAECLTLDVQKALKEVFAEEFKDVNAEDIAVVDIQDKILTKKTTSSALVDAIKKVQESSSSQKGSLLTILLLAGFLDTDMTLKGDQPSPTSPSPLSPSAVAKAKKEKWDDVVAECLTLDVQKALKETFAEEFKDVNAEDIAIVDIQDKILTKKDTSADLVAALCKLKFEHPELSCPAPITDPATARARVLSLAQESRLRDQAAESTTLGYSVGGWLTRNLGLSFTGPLTFDVGLTGKTEGFKNARTQVGEPVNTEAASKRAAISMAPSSTYDLGAANGYKLLSVALPLAYASEGLWGSSTHTLQYALALSLIKKEPDYRRPNLYLALQGTHYLSDNSVVPNLHEGKGFRLGVSARDANLYNWHGAWGLEGDFQLGAASRGAEGERTWTEVAGQIGVKYSNQRLYAHTGLRLFSTTNSTDQSTGTIIVDNLPKQEYQVSGTSFTAGGAQWYGGALADLYGHQLSGSFLLGHRDRNLAAQYESPILLRQARLPRVGVIGDLSVEASARLSNLTLTENNDYTQFSLRGGLRISRPSFAITPYVTLGTESAPNGTGVSWGGGVRLELPFSGAGSAQRDNLRALVGEEGMAPVVRSAYDSGRALLGIERLNVEASPDLRTLSFKQLLDKRVDPKRNATQVAVNDIAPVVFYMSGINDDGLNPNELESRQIVSMSDFAKDKAIAKEIWDALVAAGYIQEKDSDGEPRGLVAQAFSSVRYSDFLASSSFLPTQKTRFYQTLSNAPKLQAEGRALSGSPAKTRALEIFAARNTMGLTTALSEATTLAGDLLSALRVVRDRFTGDLSAFPGLDEAFRAQAATQDALNFAQMMLGETNAAAFLAKQDLTAPTAPKTSLTKDDVEKIIQFADAVNTEADSLAAAAKEAAPPAPPVAPAPPPAVPSAFGKIEAEDFVDKKVSFRLFNRMKVEEKSGVKSLIYIKNGDEASYGEFDFGDDEQERTFIAKASSGTNGGEITIVVDGKDKYTCHVPKTGDWNVWGEGRSFLPKLKGKHTIKLMFKGEKGFLFDLDSFTFVQGKQGTATPKPAEPQPVEPPPPPAPPASSARPAPPLANANPGDGVLAPDAAPATP